MGKFSRWIRSFLTGKKQKDVEKCTRDDELTSVLVVESPATPVSWPPTTPKDKKRRSFRRPSASATCAGVRNATGMVVASPLPPPPVAIESEKGIRRYDPSFAVRAAFEEAAATRIQAYYRSYLARKALCALRGIVKLQALIRGHLVRKQTSTAIRCMQAMLMVQSRARAQRFHQQRSAHRRSTHRRLETDMGNEDRFNDVEMNVSKCKADWKGRKRSPRFLHSRYEDPRYSASPGAEEDDGYLRQDVNQISPAPSVTYEASPRLSRGYLGEYPVKTTRSHLRYGNLAPELVPPEVQLTLQQARCAELLPNEYPFYPSYMANTTSSRAKARSYSAPKSQPDVFERQPSRRRMSVEGRNVPRPMRMQQSSSQVDSAVQGYRYPLWIKLDQSMASLKDSECGSTSTLQTNTHYCRSVVGYDVVDGQ